MEAENPPKYVIFSFIQSATHANVEMFTLHCGLGYISGLLTFFLNKMSLESRYFLSYFAFINASVCIDMNLIQKIMNFMLKCDEHAPCHL
jgi:hypothetical protein